MGTISLLLFPHAPRRDGAPGLAGLLSLWVERLWQRRGLAEMDDHMLRDIGLTRAQVEAETAKLPWQA
ncbi:MAG TPA: DUF1127 domain-containing protein [Azospirillaceae bacterium]|nr:DUF1127 domain-containing protein [Azospirillaceae bacterium]